MRERAQKANASSDSAQTQNATSDAAQQHTASSDTLVSGATVRLSGLKGAAHLNGLTGVCESLDASSGRWVVCLDESGEKKSLKADNLTVEQVPQVPPPAPPPVDEDSSLRMSSDPESGFIACDTAFSARQALEDGERRVEFNGISTAAELDKCLELVDEFLAAAVDDAHTPLEGLSFASCSLKIVHLGRLAKCLRHDAGQKLVAFGISKNPGVEGVAWTKLFQALPQKATWLDFGDNQLSDADLAPLVDCLPGRDMLDKLYLDGNRIGDLSSLCEALPDTGITNLDLGDNDIGDVAVATLAKSLSKSVIMILVLGTNPITASGVSTLFYSLPRSSLDTLYLDNTGADDTSLADLAEVLSDSKLTELHLDSTKITDAGVRTLLPHIAQSELSFIDVAECGVSDETVELIEKSALGARPLKEGEEEPDEA